MNLISDLISIQHFESYIIFKKGYCYYCGKVLPKYKRKYCSDKCQERFNHYNWLNTWSYMRDFILERDNYQCQSCSKEEGLEVHHIKAKVEGGLDVPHNLITLCKKCHKRETRTTLVFRGIYRQNLNKIKKLSDFYKNQKNLFYYF